MLSISRYAGFSIKVSIYQLDRFDAQGNAIDNNSLWAMHAYQLDQGRTCYRISSLKEKGYRNLRPCTLSAYLARYFATRL